MKFKKLSIVFLIITIMTILAGCTQDSSSSSVVDQIKSKGKLVMGTSADYPPFEFHAQIDGRDEIVGIDISIAQEIAKDLGVELEIMDMDFDGLLAALASNTVDIIIAAMNATDERKDSVIFSNEYYIAEQRILVRTQDMEKFKSIDDLKSAKIGVQKGTLQAEIAEKILPDNQTRALGKVTDLILDLKANNVDAIILEKPVAEAYAANTDGIDVSEMEIKSDDTSGYAVAIKKGNTELEKEVNKTIERIKNDNSFDELFKNILDQ